jgi:hypothetical protein
MKKSSPTPKGTKRGTASQAKVTSSLPTQMRRLITQTQKDLSAPFEPKSVEALRKLKSSDKQAYEQVRGQLKAAGCRVSELDKIIGDNGQNQDRRPSQSDILLELASDLDLFHSADGTAYADATVDDHRETWPVKSQAFRRWLASMYFRETGGAASPDSLNSVVLTLEASARVNGSEREVHVRVGHFEDRLYIDLGDPTWKAIEVAADGWGIVDCPPCRFKRSSGMLALPAPKAGGTIEQLRPFLNLDTDLDFVLAVSWLLATLRDAGPYPVLVVTGEQGSSKSTFSELLRTLVDPNTALLRSFPREERDLYISARASHVLAFDNVSGITPWLSDAVCKIATGAAFAARKLYTDEEEILLAACRPTILNGIDDLLSRQDLADRSIMITLAPIPDEMRRPKTELLKAFSEEQPMILGALLDALSEGIRRLPLVKLDRLPRMADFATLAIACETAFWPEGTFMKAYDANRMDLISNSIDGDPTADAVRSLMMQSGVWEGTATNLLNVLGRIAGDQVKTSLSWPRDPRSLSNKLKRSATFLRNLNIKIEFTRKGREGSRIIRLTKHDTDGTQGGIFLSAASASSARAADSKLHVRGFVPRTASGLLDFNLVRGPQ